MKMEKKAGHVLVADLGSTRVKAAVFGGEGRVSDAERVSVEGVIDESGLIQIAPYQAALQDVIAQLSEWHDSIQAIGITGIGPTLVLGNRQGQNVTLPAKGRSYRLRRELVERGMAEVSATSLPDRRYIALGPQFTPEQLAQLRQEGEDIARLWITSLTAAAASGLSPALLNYLASPMASYMGLIEPDTGEYLPELFEDIKFPRDIFPQLTEGKLGLVLLNGREVPLYELGVDGPTLQSVFGEDGVMSLGFGTTIAARLRTTRPLASLPWNVRFSVMGKAHFVGGKAGNAGVGTWQHFWPKDTAYENMEADYARFLRDDGLEDFLRTVPIELPFENGARDGAAERAGLYTRGGEPAKRLENEIALFYVITEGVLFHLLQLVRDLPLATGYLATGVLAKSGAIRELFQVMVSSLLASPEAELLLPADSEAELLAGAIRTFELEETASRLPRFSERQSYMLKLAPAATAELKRRWGLWQELAK